MPGTSKTIINKQPSEKLLLGMDFSATLSSTDVLSTPTITVDIAGLTIDTITIVGQKVNFFVSGGVDGQNYRINVVVNVSTGEILEGDGILKVRDL